MQVALWYLSMLMWKHRGVSHRTVDAAAAQDVDSTRHRPVQAASSASER